MSLQPRWRRQRGCSRFRGIQALCGRRGPASFGLSARSGLVADIWGNPSAS